MTVSENVILIQAEVDADNSSAELEVLVALLLIEVLQKIGNVRRNV